MEKTNAVTKNSELTSVLNTHFQRKINLARVKLIALFISSLCKVQSATFSKLANAFDSTANTSPFLRRIQRFIVAYTLEADLIAKLVFNVLPKQDKLKLTIDRTNWKFKQTFVWCYKVGIHIHLKVKPISIKKHGRKAKTIFKYELDYIANTLLKVLNQININHFLSCA